MGSAGSAIREKLPSKEDALAGWLWISWWLFALYFFLYAFFVFVYNMAAAYGGETLQGLMHVSLADVIFGATHWWTSDFASWKQVRGEGYTLVGTTKLAVAGLALGFALVATLFDWWEFDATEACATAYAQNRCPEAVMRSVARIATTQGGDGTLRFGYSYPSITVFALYVIARGMPIVQLTAALAYAVLYFPWLWLHAAWARQRELQRGVAPRCMPCNRSAKTRSGISYMTIAQMANLIVTYLAFVTLMLSLVFGLGAWLGGIPVFSPFSSPHTMICLSAIVALGYDCDNIVVEAEEHERIAQTQKLETAFKKFSEKLTEEEKKPLAPSPAPQPLGSKGAKVTPLPVQGAGSAITMAPADAAAGSAEEEGQPMLGGPATDVTDRTMLELLCCVPKHLKINPEAPFLRPVLLLSFSALAFITEVIIFISLYIFVKAQDSTISFLVPSSYEAVWVAVVPLSTTCGWNVTSMHFASTATYYTGSCTGMPVNFGILGAAEHSLSLILLVLAGLHLAFTAWWAWDLFHGHV